MLHTCMLDYYKKNPTDGIIVYGSPAEAENNPTPTVLDMDAEQIRSTKGTNKLKIRSS